MPPKNPLKKMRSFFNIKQPEIGQRSVVENKHNRERAPGPLSIDRKSTIEDRQNNELYQPLVDIDEMRPRPYFEGPLEFHPIWGSVYSLPIDSGLAPLHRCPHNSSVPILALSERAPRPSTAGPNLLSSDSITPQVKRSGTVKYGFRESFYMGMFKSQSPSYEEKIPGIFQNQDLLIMDDRNPRFPGLLYKGKERQQKEVREILEQIKYHLQQPRVYQVYASILGVKYKAVKRILDRQWPAIRFTPQFISSKERKAWLEKQEPHGHQVYILASVIALLESTDMNHICHDAIHANLTMWIFSFVIHDLAHYILDMVGQEYIPQTMFASSEPGEAMELMLLGGRIISPHPEAKPKEVAMKLMISGQTSNHIHIDWRSASNKFWGMLDMPIPFITEEDYLRKRRNSMSEVMPPGLFQGAYGVRCAKPPPGGGDQRSTIRKVFATVKIKN